MKIDSDHRHWLIFTLVSTALFGTLYAACLHPEWLPFSIDLPALLGPVPPLRRSFAGTPLGLLFGALAFLIFLFASALGLRKKRRLWPIVRVQWWLKAHIWLTVLTLPLVLLHCGFSTGGPHTTWLLALYGLVMASGVYGAVLQHLLPRKMRERLPREVVFEAIPQLQSDLRRSAEKLRDDLRERERCPAHVVNLVRGTASGQSETAGIGDRESAQMIFECLNEHVLPYLSGTSQRLNDAAAAADIFRLARLNVENNWHPEVDRMESWCTQLRMMQLQTKYHHWLHGWLFVHVPASVALLLFTAWHAWIAVRFLVLRP